jgi:hypothetical protein
MASGKPAVPAAAPLARRALGEIGNSGAAAPSAAARAVVRSGVHEGPFTPAELNVDAVDAEEPAAVSDYVPDIYAFFKAQEVRGANLRANERGRGGARGQAPFPGRPARAGRAPEPRAGQRPAAPRCTPPSRPRHCPPHPLSQRLTRNLNLNTRTHAPRARSPLPPPPPSPTPS